MTFISQSMILPYILKTIWCLYIILSEYESVRPNVWPKNKCRSLNIILGDYGSVWPAIWPLNNCMSLWPVFHGPLIFPYVSNTVCWMSVIFLDDETVWHKLWPQNKYRSIWLIFHGLVILFNIFKIIWWVNIIVGISDQCDTKIDLIKYM